MQDRWIQLNSGVIQPNATCVQVAAPSDLTYRRYRLFVYNADDTDSISRVPAGVTAHSGQQIPSHWRALFSGLDATSEWPYFYSAAASTLYYTWEANMVGGSPEGPTFALI